MSRYNTRKEPPHGKTAGVTDEPYNHKRPRLPWDNLKSREAEVALWAVRGYSNTEIGEILFIAPKTVENYLAGVYYKLGADRCRLTYFAMRDGFVTDEPPDEEPEKEGLRLRTQLKRQASRL